MNRTCPDPAAFPASGSLQEQVRFLLHYAVLAPSSHNSQPWLFRTVGNGLEVLADDRRWLRVADPDRRELYLSVGCALENLLVAAEHFGLGHTVRYCPDPAAELAAARVQFGPSGQPEASRPPELFDAIPVRHTNHQPYDERPVPEETQQRLQELVREPGIRLWLTGDPRIRDSVNELVVRADALQFADPAYRRELAYWIGQGVFGTSWLVSRMGSLAVSYLNMGKPQGTKDSALLMSAPVLGLITGGDDRRETQVRAGQVYERIALLAASEGLWTHPMSQIMEVPECRAEVARLLPADGGIPLHPFRLGFAAPEETRTPRRSLEEVLAVG